MHPVHLLTIIKIEIKYKVNGIECCINVINVVWKEKLWVSL
jgi:hypothetical protein